MRSAENLPKRWRISISGCRPIRAEHADEADRPHRTVVVLGLRIEYMPSPFLLSGGWRATDSMSFVACEVWYPAFALLHRWTKEAQNAG